MTGTIQSCDQQGPKFRYVSGYGAQPCFDAGSPEYIAANCPDPDAEVDYKHTIIGAIGSCDQRTYQRIL